MEKTCNICPRNCNVDRSKTLGFCKSSDKIKISHVMIHYFEEPLVSGDTEHDTIKSGSGAIFFGSCNLKCVYCQNSEISSGGYGKEVSPETLANLFAQLEERHANNINLVSPTHFTEQIIEALKIYRPKIPIVWNTSGYEKQETIKKLAPFVDVYLTDLKYHSSKLSKELSQAPDYYEEASKAILQMRKNQPLDIIQNGLIKKGVIIRHLCLPNQTRDSIACVDWIYNNLGNKTIVSLMSQYVPMAKAHKHPSINRTLKPLEYKAVVSHLDRLEFENAFIQELASANDCYTPDFAKQDDSFKF